MRCIALLSGVTWPALIVACTILWARLIIDPCVGVSCDAPDRFANAGAFFFIVLPLAIATAATAWTVIIGLITRKLLPVQTSVRIRAAFCLVVVAIIVMYAAFAMMISDVSAPVVCTVAALATSLPAAIAVFTLTNEAKHRAIVLYGRPPSANHESMGLHDD